MKLLSRWNEDFDYVFIQNIYSRILYLLKASIIDLRIQKSFDEFSSKIFWSMAKNDLGNWFFEITLTQM